MGRMNGKGFSLLELLIAIAILSLMVTSITVAFTQLNDGINDAFVRKNQSTQFYNVENLFAIDFSYHNVGVDEPAPPCYLSFSSNTWYSSCTDTRTEFAQENDAIMLCYQPPQTASRRKVAYYFSSDDNTVCRYQWEANACDGAVNTAIGSDDLSSSVTDLSCDTSILEEVESITFTNQGNGATQIDVSFNNQAGVNQATSIADDFSVTLTSRNINPELVMAELAISDYAVRDGDNLTLTVLLTEALDEDVDIAVDSGDLGCSAPCQVSIDAGDLSGTVTLNENAGSTVGDVITVSLLPGADFLLGQNYQATVNVIDSAANDADHSPSLSILPSLYSMAPNGTDITVTLTLSQTLTNAVDIDLTFTGMSCGASNDYNIAGATTTGCPGTAVTVRDSISAGSLNASFMIDPKNFTSNDRLAITAVANSALTVPEDTLFIDAIPSTELPTIEWLSSNRNITIPHNTSAQYNDELRIGIDTPLPNDIEISLNTSGSLVCNTDYVFVGANCSDNHTLEAHQDVLVIPIQWRYHSDNNHNETAVFSLPMQTDLQVNTSKDDVTITAQELSEISFATSSSIATAGTFTITLNATPALNNDIDIDYTISGTATNADYTLTTSDWSMDSGDSTLTITLSNIVLDTVSETVILTIDEVYGKAYLGTNNEHTVTIN